MRRIGPAKINIQEIQGDSEVVVLLLSTVEHDELHRNPKEFVNKRHVFAKDVSSVELRPEVHPMPPTGSSIATSNVSATETLMSVIIHRPGCTCVGACTPLTET